MKRITKKIQRGGVQRLVAKSLNKAGLGGVRYE